MNKKIIIGYGILVVEGQNGPNMSHLSGSILKQIKFGPRIFYIKTFVLIRFVVLFEYIIISFNLKKPKACSVK